MTDDFDRILASQGDLGLLVEELEQIRQPFPQRVDSDPERVERASPSSF